jgi:tetratricopeptide (TPR) repeat protein
MKSRIGLILLILLAIAAPGWSSGEGAATLYNQGNALYAKGDFAGAVRSYEHALLQRVADPRLEQNLGSAYIKVGDVGNAIFYFERGLLLDPRNDDLQHDLDFAKALRKDEVPEHSGVFPFSLLTALLSHASTGEFVAFWTVLYLLLVGLVLALVYVQGRARPVLLTLAIVFGGLVLIATPFTSWKLYETHLVDRAIITADEVVARSGPGESNQEAFTVHGGMPCKVHDRRGGWASVTIATGLSGWVPDRAARSLSFGR